jgi:magnesium transporter
VISGIWLLQDGRAVLTAFNDARPSAMRTTEPGTVAMSTVAHRGELSELLSRARAARRKENSSYLWIDVVYPTAFEMAMLADVLHLPKLQVEDALTPRQRPKLERSGNNVFLVMKALSYLEATSDIETHQVSAFAGPGYLLTIAHGRYDVADAMRKRLAREPQLRRRGSASGLYALLDVVVDQYLAAGAEIGHDIEEIEESVFSPERTDDSAAIYRLKRENLELRRAVGPLTGAASMVARGSIEQIDEQFQPYFADVADHLLRVADAAENNDQLLMTMLMASTARQDLQQNEDMRRISAYVAIAAVPTMIAGIYGMNFAFMPELDEVWGYPFALSLMGVICYSLYRAFKRSGWLCSAPPVLRRWSAPRSTAAR